MIKKFRPELYITVISIIAAILIGLTMITDPLALGKDSGKFSAENAYSYLENIAEEPHSVFDRANLEEVRQYLVHTMESFGVTPNLVRQNDTIQTNSKTGTNETVEIYNIYAELPGTSGRYILLMAHYDSSPYKIKYNEVSQGSHGAADDGYGVASMLEIMRLLKNSGKPLVNGVKFVFTDSEETGLNGAQAVINENSQYLKDVNLVVNVEARGNRGPLYMFQTSSNNSKIIDLYSKVDRPFSFSVAAEVYKYLPSDTDLTPFLNEGYNAINFATLNDLKNYHTQNDILENASQRTLQAYGTQVYPLVKEYVYHNTYSGSDSFNSKSDSVFFTVFPGILIHYPVDISWFIIAFTVLFTIAVSILTVMQKMLNILKVLKSLTMWVLFTAAAAAAGYLAVLLPCLITGKTFHLTFMPYVPFDRGFLVISAFLVYAAALGYVKLHKKLKCNPMDILTGGMYLNVVCLLLFAFVLHGGTYLFLWPVLFMDLYLLSAIFMRDDKRWHVILRQTVRVIFTVYTVLMYFLLVYSLFLALTIGALAVMLLLMGIPLSILIPSQLPVNFRKLQQDFK